MMNTRHSFSVMGLGLSLLLAIPAAGHATSPNPSAVAAVAQTTPAADRCYADWSDASPIVRHQALVTVKDIHELARKRQIGDLVKVTLCEENSRFVYRLVVREPTGRIVALTIDARKPFDR